MIEYIDLIAFSWLVICWLGYDFLIGSQNKGTCNIATNMYNHISNWMKESIKRDDRDIDIITITNLIRSASFFASTSLIIIAGLIPMIGYGDKANLFISVLPYTISNPSPIWEMKTIFLLLIFANAFFKFSWSLRQYNYASIMVVSAPKKGKINEIAENNAKILANANRHFNMGIRCFYFATATLAWYLNPYLLIFTSSLVSFIIIRRDFLSKALKIIRN